MVQWLAPVAPDPPPDGAPAAGLTDDEIFAQRGDHALWFHPTDEALWQEHLPYIAWQHRSAGGALRQGVVAGEIARVVLPFVVLDEGAADLSFVAWQPTPAAWTRWLDALARAEVQPHPASLSTYLREIDTKLCSAAPDISAALRLEVADLAPTQILPDGAYDTLPGSTVSALRAGDRLCWGMLAGEEDKLRKAADLIYHSGSIFTASARLEGSDWLQTLVTLYNVGIVDRAITTVNQADPDHVSNWMVRLLQQTELDPMLELHHAQGFKRLMSLRDRVAERAGAAGRGEAGNGMVAQRLPHVLVHYPLTGLLVATGPMQPRLVGQARVDLVLRAARTLLPAGAVVANDLLSLHLLQMLEDALSKSYGTLLADADFQSMGPPQRLVDLSDRMARSAAASTQAEPARRSGSAELEDSTAGGVGKDLVRVPKHWRDHMMVAQSTPEYLAGRKDVLARIEKSGPDTEADVIWMCATGESRERVSVRLAAGAKDATEEARALASGLQPRFSTLLFFFAHNVYEADAVDPTLAVVSTFAADYWPGMIARRLAAVLFPFDAALPAPLLGATCPKLVETLQGKDWHLADIYASVRYLRALMSGRASATESDFAASAASTPFGDPSTLEQQRRYYAVVLALFGYPDTDAEYGWGNALARASTFWESYHGVNADVDTRIKQIISVFLTAQFKWMGRHMHSIKTLRDPTAARPSAELDRCAWTAFIQGEGDLRKALASAGLARWYNAYHSKEEAPYHPKQTQQGGGRSLPKGAAVMPADDRSGFQIKKADGTTFKLSYASINAELNRKGVQKGEESKWCCKDILGQAIFGASACHAKNCTRLHGPLPSKRGFSIHSCLNTAGQKPPSGKDAAGDEAEPDGGEEQVRKKKKTLKRKKTGATGSSGAKAAKAVAAAAAAEAVPGAEGHQRPATGDPPTPPPASTPGAP